MNSNRPFPMILAALYALLLALVAAAAVYAWRIRCEGFGCNGVGIVWFAWTLLFAFALAVGLAAKHLTRLDAPIKRALHWGIVAQLVIGAFLVAAWARHTLA